jgi:hypothetical protein
MEEICVGGLVIVVVVTIWGVVQILKSINWRLFWGGTCLLALVIAFLIGGPSGEEILVVAGWFLGDRALKAIAPSEKK